jgi:Fe-Mn family superoxide dismutase
VLITRRNLIAGTASVAAAVAARPAVVYAQAVHRATPAPTPPGPFKLDPLLYPTNALAPNIDARTMEIHHDRHHLAYVSGLNAAAKDHTNVASMPLQEILAKLGEMPESVRTQLRNFGGGHANHTMFWLVMGPRAGKPTGDLAAAIERDFGGLNKLQDDFNTAGARLFGSGWVFVTVSTEGNLGIETRPNQDTPLMDAKRVLMGNDVWEHAYYLTYQNRRPDYLKAWWNTVDWTRVGERYKAATAGTLTI